MKHACHKLLARAAFTMYQDGNAASGQKPDLFYDLHCLFVGAYYLVRVIGIRLERQRSQAAVSGRAVCLSLLNYKQNAVDVKRLAQVIERSGPHCLDGGFCVLVAGDHYHRKAVAFGLNIVEHVDAASVRKLEVQQGEVGHLLAERADPFGRGVGAPYHVPARIEMNLQRSAQVFVVVNYQDVAHCWFR